MRLDLKKDGFDTNIPVVNSESNWLHIARDYPKIMTDMHWHQHIEINYLHGCSMTYQLADELITLPAHKLGILWASLPHKVVDIQGKGEFTCIYLSLHQFRTWDLPLALHSQIMHKGIIIADHCDSAIEPLLSRWHKDCNNSDIQFQQQALDEIRVQLKRMAMSGWIKDHNVNPQRVSGKSLLYVEKMLEYISENFQEMIGVKEIAAHVDLHPNYAISVFKQLMGMPITAYLTRHRLSHAQALLLNTDQKILDICLQSGFNSQSRFYEVFNKLLKTTPKQYRDKWRR